MPGEPLNLDFTWTPSWPLSAGTVKANVSGYQLLVVSLRVTPAVEAGVADHVWSLEEIAQLAVA